MWWGRGWRGGRIARQGTRPGIHRAQPFRQPAFRPKALPNIVHPTFVRSLFAGGLASFVMACGEPTQTAFLIEPQFAKSGTGCAGIPGGTKALVVTPSSAVIKVGQTATYLVRNQAGVPVPACAVSWSSSDIGIASVDSTGLARGIGIGGPATLQASASSGRKLLIGSATVQVNSPVVTVVVTPKASPVLAGGSLQMTVVAQDGNGNVVSGRPVVWTVASPAVAAVSSGGVVTGVAPGATIVSAVVDGMSDAATITTVPVPVASVSVVPDTATLSTGASRQLVAVARDSIGGVLTGRAVTWTSTNPSALPITSTGVVSAVASGAAEIWADVEGKRGSAALSAVQRVASVTLAPLPDTLVVGDTLRFSPSIRDDLGVVIPGRTILWTSSVPSAATVGSDGLLKATGAGSTQVSATVDGVTATATVNVRTPIRDYLSFDGVNDWVSVAGSIFTNYAAFHTIEMWLRSSNDSQPAGHFFSKSGEFYRDVSMYYQRGILGARFVDPNGSVSKIEVDTPVDISTWTHVAWVKDGGVMRLFVNGRLVKSAYPSTYWVRWDDPYGTGYVVLGRANPGANMNFFFDGDIGAVRISGTALYSSDFVPPRFTKDVSTLLLYNFLTPGVGTLTDESGGNHAGTIYGASWKP